MFGRDEGVSPLGVREISPLKGVYTLDNKSYNECERMKRSRDNEYEVSPSGSRVILGQTALNDACSTDKTSRLLFL